MNDPFSGARSIGRALLGAIVVRLVISFAFIPLRYVVPRSVYYSAFTAHKWALLLATIVVIVLHIVFVRGYFVALAATGRSMKQSPNFTIAAWFIPFANFVLPLLSVKQAYEAQRRSSGITIGWWIAYLVFVVNNGVQLRVPYIGIVIAVVVFGLWFVMVKGLIDASNIPAPAFAMGGPAAAPYASAPPAGLTFPPEWSWVWAHHNAGNLKVLGYYYRDKMAGFSLKILVDLSRPMAAQDIAAAARAMEYRANTTLRLGAHETINVEGLPPDFAAMMRGKYESGESPAGPGTTILLRLTRQERDVLGLPNAPPHMEVYL